MFATDSSESETEPNPPLRSHKKRKRDLHQDEIEIDVSAPEPPSKKALRKSKKKGTTAIIGDGSQAKDGKLPRQDTEDDVENKDGSSSVQKKSEHGIWIGNLPFTATKDDLSKFLTSNTAIDEKQIIRIKMPVPKDTAQTDKSGGQSNRRSKPQNKGFAYVDFDTELAKTQAIALSEKLLTGRAVLIKDALSFEGRPKPTDQDSGSKLQSKHPPAKRIFVGNLSFDATKEEMERHFSRCGIVEDVFLTTFEDTGKCKGYGWVTFDSTDAAAAAVQGWVNMEPESEDEEEGGSEAHKDRQASEKKRKPRKWWVNRMGGRSLRVEFAEDPTTRYNKRFGKEGKSTKSVAEETMSGEAPQKNVRSGTEAPSVRKDDDGVGRQATTHDQGFKALKKMSGNDGPAARVLEKMRGNIVVAEGKKIIFD